MVDISDSPDAFVAVEDVLVAFATGERAEAQQLTVGSCVEHDPQIQFADAGLASLVGSVIAAVGTSKEPGVGLSTVLALTGVLALEPLGFVAVGIGSVR